MSDPTSDKRPQEIVIIKRHANHEEVHHGGAWKIAFADFMTAMMALFLVLWLISSTSEKTKHAIAQYFNPVKLIDMTTMKKGFRDPKNTEMAAGPKGSESELEANTNKDLAETREVNEQAGAKRPTHSEAALFRDPYAVLAEIVGNAPRDEEKHTSGPAEAAIAAPPTDTAEAFNDPFATVARIPDPEAQSEPSTEVVKSGSLSAGSDLAQRFAGTNDHASSAGRRAISSRPSGADAQERPQLVAQTLNTIAEASQANEADAELKSKIVALAKQDSRLKNGPRIEIQSTGEGILISLTDDQNYSMFAIGSAEPEPRTIEIMAKIGAILKTRPGAIVIRGYTDIRPYKSGNYDNWRLSAARADIAHYMLVRGDLDEKRIEKIEGYADRRLKIPSDPNAAGNRRIEILLRKEKP